MTKDEAIEAMKQGKSVRHRHFTDEEYLSSNESGDTLMLDGKITIAAEEYWLWRQEDYFLTDWEIV